jgi:hypothetical protein
VEPLSTFVIMVAKELYSKGQASNDEMFGWHSFWGDVWVAFVLGMFGWHSFGDVWVAFGQYGYSEKKTLVKVSLKFVGYGIIAIAKSKSMLDSSNT